MIRRVGSVVVAVVILAVGCSRRAEVPSTTSSGGAATPAHQGWDVVPSAELTTAQKAQLEKGRAAVQAMAGRLMGELTAALDAGGPASAIDVCRMRAPEIAAAVSNEYGLVIGRTSFRLRNPSNAAPAWAADLVGRRVAEPIWLAAPDGRLGGLLPIRLKAECGLCHGPKERIAPEVRSALAASYPDDAATGFVEGDLRGWFWVEVPSAS